MTTTPQLSIVVPAYNEAKSIVSTLTSICNYLEQGARAFEVILVADGNDGTRELASELTKRHPQLSVMGSAARRGKGRGIREGVARARGAIIGFIDADYKTPIEEIEKILPLLETECDVAIGSRALSDSRIDVHQPFYRRVGSRAFGVALHLMLGLWQIRDTQCGFKFFRASVAHDLFSRQVVDGYMFDVEVLRLAELSGYRIREVGVRWRDDGDSRLDLVAGNWRNMLDMLRIYRYTSGMRPQLRAAPAAEYQLEVDKSS